MTFYIYALSFNQRITTLSFYSALFQKSLNSFQFVVEVKFLIKHVLLSKMMRSKVKFKFAKIIF